MKNKPIKETANVHVQAAISAATARAEAATPAQPREGIAAAWNNFWFTPADPLGLHILRMLAGLLFLFWLLPLAGSVEAFLSFNGWFGREGYLELSRLPPQERPYHLGWSLLYTIADNPSLVQAFYWGTIGVLILFTLGIAPRLMSVLVWVLVVSYVSFLAGPAGRSEDDLFTMLAFYLMIGYLLLGRFSWKLSTAEQLVGATVFPLGKLEREGGVPRTSYAANLAVRLFQVNFALVMLASCFNKMAIGDWWSGVGFWYPLHQPFDTKRADIYNAARHAMSLLFLYSLAQYLFVAWQLTFPVWAWRRGRFFRIVLVGGGIIGALGCVWVYQAPEWAPFYLIGCLAFLTSEEWHGFGERMRKLWQKEKEPVIEPAKRLPTRAPVAVQS